VLVLGERLWRTHFAANPDVIGRTVGLGAGRSTIVGVLPASFAFPTHHRAWAPLRLDALPTGPREGSPIGVFGRLAPGVSLAGAQAELSALGGRTAAANPATHEHIRPEVVPYARAVLPVSWSTVLGVASGVQLAMLLFLVMLCVNVATLVFARTSARENEIVVRSALGASRARIVTQVFAETLVLGAIAAIVGVAAAGVCARLALTAYEAFARPLPFWVRAELSATTVLYAVFLTVLGSVIAGVVPALKVTRGLAGGLRASAVGGASLRFGRVWQGLIVAQVALTMIFMAVALDTLRDAGRARRLAFGFPAGQHLTAMVQMHRETAATETAEVPYTDEERARFRTTFQALQRRLAAEPDVAAVTYAQTFPGTFHDLQRIQVEGSAQASSAPLPLVEIGSVAVDFFAALGVPVLAGRDFHPADIPAGPPSCTGCDQLSDAIVVNETLERRLFGGRGAVGRRVRFVDARNADRWHEIVGVVGDIAMNGDPMLLRRLQGGGIYRAWAPGATYSAGISVRVRGAPEGLRDALPCRHRRGRSEHSTLARRSPPRPPRRDRAHVRAVVAQRVRRRRHRAPAVRRRHVFDDGVQRFEADARDRHPCRAGRESAQHRRHHRAARVLARPARHGDRRGGRRLLPRRRRRRTRGGWIRRGPHGARRLAPRRVRGRHAGRVAARLHHPRPPRAAHRSRACAERRVRTAPSARSSSHDASAPAP
jgi:putative ABC transport system permease protein